MNVQLSGQYPRRKNTIVAGNWGLGSELMVHERHRKPAESTSPGFSSSTELIRFKWNSAIFDSKPCRELISESCNIFTLINSVKGEGGSHSTSEVIKTSRKYRSIIRSCLERLQDIESESHLLSIFKDIERSWSLLEILFLDTHTPGILVGQLMFWLQWHFPENERRLQDILASEDPSSHTDYWSTMKGLLIRGQVKEARMLLALYTDPQFKQFADAILELLMSMPVFGPGQLSHEFDLSWQRWSNDCHTILDTGYFDSHAELSTILKVLCGDRTAIMSIQNEETTWYHSIPAQILYGDPFMKELELSSLAKDALESLTRPEDYTSFDMLIVSAFNYELMEVIRQGCLFNDNWWFVAHFVDLMSAGNQLKHHDIEKEDRLREFLILDYAETLVAHSSLWSLSVEYFDACPEIGRQRLETALEKVTLDNERKANEVLSVAMKRRLKFLFRTICRTMSQKWLSKESMASALVWAVKAEDAHICSSIADSMLKTFVETGSFVDTDVISCLGTKMLISDRLTFLAKYYEFYEIMKQPESEAKPMAADLLVSLIASNISPPYFVPVLLLDADTLLDNHDSEQPLFDAGQTCQILAAFEDVLDIFESGDDESLNGVTNEKMNQLKEKESKLRLALERVLCHSSLNDTSQ